MKTTPMPFNGDMIRALIDGRKTQARRPIKHMDADAVRFAEWSRGGTIAYFKTEDGSRLVGHETPFGTAGDLIWARETWSGDYAYADDKPSERVSVMTPDGPYHRESIWYWADGDPDYGDWERPRPSVHMPRWASRLTLRITDVRVERVQSISEADAAAEGVHGITTDTLTDDERALLDLPLMEDGAPHRNEFALTWNSIYANRSRGWDANPWVWALTFEVIDANVDDVASQYDAANAEAVPA